MNASGFRGIVLLIVMLWSMTHAFAAVAATRAWIDRDTIALGDTVTLNIETDQATASPDYTPLRADFDLGEPSSSRQVQVVNGVTSAKSLFGIALMPRGEGQLTIPALQVGAQRSSPLTLKVTPGRPAAPVARGQAPVFIETEVDDIQPYVQQNVGMRVRLYYAISLSGQLDVDTPDGASLQAIGNDVRSSQDINGRRYQIVERRYLLIPERSGKLAMPVARFKGQSMDGGVFDELFDRGTQDIRVSSPPQTLTVRPQPDGVTGRWLPLRELRLRYTHVPQQVRSGEAATLEVEAVAEGGTRAQFPDLPMLAVEGARVFAEPVQYEEAFVDGSPHLTMTRRYSLVPSHEGVLNVPGLALDWWDVINGTPQTAKLDDLKLQVGMGTTVPIAPPAPSSNSATHPAPVQVAPVASPPRPLWPWLAVALALLWGLTLAWLLWQRQKTKSAPSSTKARPHASAAPLTLAELKRALNEGDLNEVADTLRAMASPTAEDIDTLIERLADPAQQRAVDGLRRARWQHGDPVAARQAVRDAFHDGPRWKTATTTPDEPLPPLYPRS